MTLYTGYRNDFVDFDNAAPYHDSWSDNGGNDVLIVANSDYFPYPDRSDYLPYWNVNQTEDGVLVSSTYYSLLLKNDRDGTLAIEYLEWREPEFFDDVVPAVLATLRIMTDTDSFTGDGFLYAGSDANERIVVPDLAEPASGFSEIYGAGGDDRILLSSTQLIRAFGGEGDDTILAKGEIGAVMYGREGQDVLIGKGGDDVIYGGKERDVIRGGYGNDTLYGDGLLRSEGGSADRIYGGAGDDHLAGGLASDILSGGPGFDLFEFLPGALGAVDTITDFNALQDSIHFDSDSLPGAFLARVETGNTILSFAETDFVVLEGVELALEDIDLTFV